MGVLATASSATTALELVTIIVPVCAAIFASITAPLILAHRTERLHREDRVEDYRRQDEVAQKVQDAADELQRKQDQIAAQAQEAAVLLSDRQDESAGKAQETADLLLAAQRATIKRTDEVARLADRGQRDSMEKLNQIDAQAKRIHTLVNSDMTAARQSELDQSRVMLVVQERMIAMVTAKGETPDPADAEAVEQTKARIKELEQILADRMTQLRKVEAEARSDVAEGRAPPENEERPDEAATSDAG